MKLRTHLKHTEHCIPVCDCLQHLVKMQIQQREWKAMYENVRISELQEHCVVTPWLCGSRYMYIVYMCGCGVEQHGGSLPIVYCCMYMYMRAHD